MFLTAFLSAFGLYMCAYPRVRVCVCVCEWARVRVGTPVRACTRLLVCVHMHACAPVRVYVAKVAIFATSKLIYTFFLRTRPGTLPWVDLPGLQAGGLQAAPARRPGG